MEVDKVDSSTSDKRVGKKRIDKRNTALNETVQKYTLRQAFQTFYQAKCAERLRQLTLRDYRKHFQYLFEWFLEQHSEITCVSDITPEVIREYIYFLSYEKPLYEGHPYRSDDGKARRGLAPGAVNVRINTLKAMFRWLHQEGLISINPTQNLSRQRVEEYRIGAFTDE